MSLTALGIFFLIRLEFILSMTLKEIVLIIELNAEKNSIV